MDADALLAGLGEVPGDRARPPSAAAAGPAGPATRGASTDAIRDRLLGIIEQRCLTGRNGATWQTAVLHEVSRTHPNDRPAALREVVRRYCRHMHENLPVHEWPVSDSSDAETP